MNEGLKERACAHERTTIQSWATIGATVTASPEVGRELALAGMDEVSVQVAANLFARFAVLSEQRGGPEAIELMVAEGWYARVRERCSSIMNAVRQVRAREAAHGA